MDKQHENSKKVNQTANKKSRFSFTWKALTIVISLLIIYTGYHIFVGLSDSVQTTHAGLVEQKNSVVLEGVIFRNEETISTKYQGDMRPYYSNGERVTTDSAVAAVYSENVGFDLNKIIEDIKDKIDILERSNIRGLPSIVDIEKLEAEIDRLYTSLMLAISNGENHKVSKIERELTVCLNKMKIYRGEVKNYNSAIESLKAELDTLYNSFRGDKEYIFADRSGYFYHSCDGYENILAYEKLLNEEGNLILGSSDLKSFVEQTKNSQKINSEYNCKFVYESTWKLASYCDEATASLLKVGEEYSITLFDAKERSLKVTLEQMSESKNGERVLLFSCSTMPEGFDYSRYQSFKLDISLIEGYRVPKEALVTIVDKNTNEKIEGVYILNASVVHFRRVDIIARGDGYYVVAKFDKTRENYEEYLNLNDVIILEPDGMHDGKILIK